MTTKNVDVAGRNPFEAAPRPLGVLGHNDAANARRWFVGDKPGPAGYGPTLPPILRQIWPKPLPMPPPTPNRVVLGQHSDDRPRRTRVTLSVTAHASPRWISARSPTKADELNLKLSREREQTVRTLAERYLRGALPDQQLIFDYKKDASPPVTDPLDSRASVDVDSAAVGSTQTLQEAGKTGRTANEDAMRRVDLAITLASAIDTDQVTTVKDKQRVSGATRNWSIKIGVEMKGELELGVGFFNFKLRNRMSGQEVEGWAHFTSAGVGVGLPIPTIDFGWNDFTTFEPAKFSDFDGRTISLGTSGFNALLFGYEWSELIITGLPGGNVSVDVGGFVMGGAGADLGEVKLGAMYLREKPDTYIARVVHDEHKYSTSRMTEVKRHRILFDTGEAKASFREETALKDFIESAAKDYQRPGAYHTP